MIRGEPLVNIHSGVQTDISPGVVGAGAHDELGFRSHRRQNLFVGPHSERGTAKGVLEELLESRVMANHIFGPRDPLDNDFFINEAQHSAQVGEVFGECKVYSVGGAGYREAGIDNHEHVGVTQCRQCLAEWSVNYSVAFQKWPFSELIGAG